MADDVLRLEVAMGHAAGVRERQCASDGTNHLTQGRDIEPAPDAELVGEAGSIQVLHHQIRLILGVDAVVEHRHDVGMPQLGAGPRFTQEPLAPA